MNVFDIIVIASAALFIAIGVWKGFLKTVLRLGAAVVSMILAKLLGPVVGGLIPDIDKGGAGLSSETANSINGAISSVVGTAVVFILLFIVLRLLAKVLAKLITRMTGTTRLDRIFGGVFGLLVAVSFVFLFAEAFKIVATAVTLVSPDSNIFEYASDSLVFKYFF